MIKKILISLLLVSFPYMAMANNTLDYTQEIPKLSALIGKDKTNVDEFIIQREVPYTVSNALDNNPEPNINGIKILKYSLPNDNKTVVSIKYKKDVVYLANIKIAYDYEPVGDANNKDNVNYKANAKKKQILETSLVDYLSKNGWEKKELVALLGFSSTYLKDGIELTVENEEDKGIAMSIVISTVDLGKAYNMDYLIEEKSNDRKNKEN